MRQSVQHEELPSKSRAPSITTLIFFTRLYTSSSVCVAVVWASSRVSLSNLCSTASTSFSPKSFFPSFSESHCVTTYQSYRTGMRLTESSLLCLLYRKGDGRQQFDENLYDDLQHCRGRWHFCVNVEALEERFERLEKLDERVVARASNILDCLKEPYASQNPLD